MKIADTNIIETMESIDPIGLKRVIDNLYRNKDIDLSLVEVLNILEYIAYIPTLLKNAIVLKSELKRWFIETIELLNKLEAPDVAYQANIRDLKIDGVQIATKEEIERTIYLINNCIASYSLKRPVNTTMPLVLHSLPINQSVHYESMNRLVMDIIKKSFFIQKTAVKMPYNALTFMAFAKEYTVNKKSKGTTKTYDRVLLDINSEIDYLKNLGYRLTKSETLKIFPLLANISITEDMTEKSVEAIIVRFMDNGIKIGTIKEKKVLEHA